MPQAEPNKPAPAPSGCDLNSAVGLRAGSNAEATQVISRICNNRHATVDWIQRQSAQRRLPGVLPQAPLSAVPTTSALMVSRSTAKACQPSWFHGIVKDHDELWTYTFLAYLLAGHETDAISFVPTYLR